MTMPRMNRQISNPIAWGSIATAVLIAFLTGVSAKLYAQKVDAADFALYAAKIDQRITVDSLTQARDMREVIGILWRIDSAMHRIEQRRR